MIRQAKQNMRRHGFDPGRVFRADIQDPARHALARWGTRQFDGLMAMGVMPHVADDDVVLRNIRRLIRPGGSVFIEFRNKLFSLFHLQAAARRSSSSTISLADVSADVRVRRRR